MNLVNCCPPIAKKDKISMNNQLNPNTGNNATKWRHYHWAVVFVLINRNKRFVNPHLTKLKLMNVNIHRTVMSLSDMCNLPYSHFPVQWIRKKLISNYKTKHAFQLNVRFTIEKDIRYGTSLKNSTDNLHTAMPLNKCQILSSVCSVEALHQICPNWIEKLRNKSWPHAMLSCWRTNKTKRYIYSI